MQRLRILAGLVVVGLLSACALTRGASPHFGTDWLSEKPPGVEDIYVLRSLREERSTPDDFCAAAKIGFAAKIQDRYVFKAVVTRAPDSKVIDVVSHPAGTLRACFDAAPGVADTDFYAEGVRANVPATGKGKCTPIASDYPVLGITSVRCFLVLSNLPFPYVAGMLTTNSVTSRQPVGAESSPPGYVQPSIATIRLWRKQ